MTLFGLANAIITPGRQIMKVCRPLGAPAAETLKIRISQRMKLKNAVVWSALLAALPGTAELHAQNPAKSGAPAQEQNANLPDACKLLAQGDLEALFPGRPVTNKDRTLSPVYKGPQYTEDCMYMIRLPSPTSKSDISKFASLTIVAWNGETEGREGSVANFANIRSTHERLAENPNLNRRLEPAPGIGEEAMLETSSFDVKVLVRKADLVYILSLDNYSPQTQPNALALAAQIAKRWKTGVGVIEAATPIAANSTVDIPEDTRTSSVAPADQWPDACVLLAPEDVRAVFSDMKIDPPLKTMGEIKHSSRIDRVEKLPKPIRCLYETSRSDLVNGERRIVTHSVKLDVSNVAATPELSKKYYQVTRKVGDAKTDVAGLGDEASISVMNAIYIRKGLLTIEVHVGGGLRDRALFDDATRRVNELAKLVAAKLP
jgi:hypothetical protein